MARKIDFSKPLSPEEQAYVADRPWLLADAKLRGEDIITDDEFVVDDADDADDNDDDGDDGASDATGDTGSDDDSSEEDGDDSDADDEDSTDDGEDDESDEDGEGDEDEVAPYDEWDYADLKTEAGNRGLSKAGSKEQLIARLQEDDGSSPE